LPFHLIISFTVVVFAFHDIFYGSLGKFIYGEHRMFTPPPKVQHQTTNLQPVSVLIAKAKELAPESDVTELRYMRLGKPGAMVRLAMKNPAYVVRGTRRLSGAESLYRYSRECVCCRDMAMSGQYGRPVVFSAFCQLWRDADALDVSACRYQRCHSVLHR
jgi:hypothetical protein